MGESTETFVVTPSPQTGRANASRTSQDASEASAFELRTTTWSVWSSALSRIALEVRR